MSIVRVYPLVGAKTPDIQIESHGVVIHSDSETVTLEFSDAFTSQPDKPTLNIANPASLNCAEVGGRLESRTSASGGEYAMCHLPNGSVCEEWALFRKECP
ncbi:MAG: DUF333 domain-containing protein [Rhodospirillales bacterium]|nr:DUF333 domain-containing protein [Rhodospirillales bacterium]